MFNYLKNLFFPKPEIVHHYMGYVDVPVEQRFKPFYIHEHGKYFTKYRGLTAYISPSDNLRQIYVQAAFCSKKDQFCKRIGREQAQLAKAELINTRQLPRWIETQKAALYGEDPNEEYIKNRLIFSNHYLKYVV